MGAWVVAAIALARAPEPGTEGLRLHWDAPPPCPSREAVEADIEALLGDTPRQPIDVVARAERQASGTWTVELELHGPQGLGRRTVADSRDCSEAAQATAVIVAIALAPSDDAPPPENEPRPPAPASDAEDPLSPPPESVVPSPVRPTPRWIASTNVGLGHGSIPAPAVGLAPELGLTLPRFRVAVSGAWWFRRRVELPGSASTEFRQWSIGLRSGPVFEPHPLVEVAPVVGLEAGQTLVRPRGLTEPPVRDPWLAALVQPMIVVAPRTMVAFRFGVELVVPILRRRYEVDRFPDVFTTPPVGVRGFVGLELRVPTAQKAE